jgi:hypothetical protein
MNNKQYEFVVEELTEELQNEIIEFLNKEDETKHLCKYCGEEPAADKLETCIPCAEILYHQTIEEEQWDRMNNEYIYD